MILLCPDSNLVKLAYGIIINNFVFIIVIWMALSFVCKYCHTWLGYGCKSELFISPAEVASSAYGFQKNFNQQGDTSDKTYPQSPATKRLSQ